MKNVVAALVGAPLLAFAFAMPAAAQTNDGAAKMTDAQWRKWQPDPAKLEMPVLDFEADDNDAKSFKKYYYFNRPDTTFETALEDVRFCDELARGLAVSNYYGNSYSNAMYGPAGIIGGAIGGAMAQAIFGSAEARNKRRVNMRRCMHFKGYARHGITKDLWQEFNFEEGLASIDEEKRQNYLSMQALVASSTLSGKEDIGL